VSRTGTKLLRYNSKQDQVLKIRGKTIFPVKHGVADPNLSPYPNESELNF
jgi:hypothetical protein